MRCTWIAVVGCVFTLQHTSSADLLYDVTFSSPPHQLGRLPVLGLGEAPRVTPSAYFLAYPIVVESVGSLAEQPLEFSFRPLDPYDIIPRGIATESIIFDVKGDRGFQSSFPEYRVEMDLTMTPLLDQHWQFAVFADAFGGLNRVIFNRDGTVDIGVSGHHLFPAGSYSFDSALHLTFDISVPEQTWTVTLNGVEIFDGPFDGDFRAVRPSLQQFDIEVAVVAGIDNVRIEGIPAPGALSAGMLAALCSVVRRRNRSA